MDKVYVSGTGQTPVGEHWDKTLANLSAAATLPALKTSGNPQVDALYVGNMLASSASNQANLGTLIADNAGLAGVETFTAEAGEASGAAALRMGYIAVRSGYVRTALVVGVEKYTDAVGPEMAAETASGLDYDFEAMYGLTPQAQAGLLTTRYMHTYNPPRAALGALPVLAHTNAVHNPNAMFRRALTMDRYTTAGLPVDGLNMYDAAPYADGAAALVLTADPEIVKASGQRPVELLASQSAVDALALHDRPDPLAFSAVTASAQKALAKAQVEWAQVDLFELWDAFNIYGILSVEASGLAARGEGWRWLAEENHTPAGEMPLVTMGGNKARGFPFGAAGVYQAVEAIMQLRGEAGENQVPGAKTALVQSMGGPASNVFTHIFSVKQR